jgi:endoglucanase
MRRTFIYICLLSSLFAASVNASAESRWRGFTFDRHTTLDQISQMKSFGANIGYFFLDPEEQQPSSDKESYLASLNTELVAFDTILNAMESNGLKVVIDLYGPPGGFFDKTAPAWHTVFHDQWAQDAIIEAWKIIAERYKGRKSIAGYNLINEPAQRAVSPGLKDWNALSVDIVAAVRQIDPQAQIIIQPLYGNPSLLSRLPIITNAIYSFNFYAPYSFTHQGLYGIKVGYVYKSDAAAKKKMLNSLGSVLKFQKKHKVRIYVAEFTAVRWAPKKSAYKYLADVLALLEAKKFDWTYHTFASQGSSGIFSNPWSVLHDDNAKNSQQSAKETDRAKLLKRYFRKNKTL